MRAFILITTFITCTLLVRTCQLRQGINERLEHAFNAGYDPTIK